MCVSGLGLLGPGNASSPSGRDVPSMIICETVSTSFLSSLATNNTFVLRPSASGLVTVDGGGVTRSLEGNSVSGNCSLPEMSASKPFLGLWRDKLSVGRSNLTVFVEIRIIFDAGLGQNKWFHFRKSGGRR